MLTREQNPPEAVIEKAEAVIEANKLNKAFLMKTRQTGCEGKDEDAGDGTETFTTLSPDAAVDNVFMLENGF